MTTRQKPEYWVVDLFRTKRFGPYTTYKEAMKVRTQVRMVSDMFCEVGSNVGIVNVKDAAPTNEPWHWMTFTVGDYALVLRTNAKMQQMSQRRNTRG